MLAGVAAAGALALLAFPAAAAEFSSKRIAVAVRGNGPDVVLIAGLAASRTIWTPTAIAVPGYRYHFVQVAGFAGWPAAGNARGEVVEPVADEVARYIRERGLKSPAIVGHSMGGTVAMMIAAKNPSLVGKLMVVDMLPQPAGLFGASSEGARGLADSLREVAAAPGGRELVSVFISMFGRDDGESVRSDPDVVARASHELALIDLTPKLPGITAPMTVVYAAPDPQARAATDSNFARAYRGKKGVKLVRIDNAGHMIMEDQPGRFQAELKSFLSS
jgi:pimeloyl-ACP methyl ester carboxylesterase